MSESSSLHFLFYLQLCNGVCVYELFSRTMQRFPWGSTHSVLNQLHDPIWLHKSLFLLLSPGSEYYLLRIACNI